NKAFFATEDGYFLALDAQTGQEQWRFSPDQRQENLPDDPECLWCALKFRPSTIANGTIYVASHDKYLYALDALSGAEQWRFHIGELAFCAPVIVDGLVYIGSQDGHIHILDAATGTEQHDYALGQEVWSVLAEGDTLYATVDNELAALNRHTGAEQWRVHHPWSAWGSFSSHLHMDDERLYLLA
ncbi:MAG: PQQ-like beta-propeller repeat protein, partial [Chloroflexi bacterium]|nr:PQQ-like beta-propeller repeat protein [Chloroflexota bacterium]